MTVIVSIRAASGRQKNVAGSSLHKSVLISTPTASEIRVKLDDQKSDKPK